MAKSKNGGSFWGELLAVGLYKKNQGRLTRQLTAVGLASILLFGTYTMSQSLLSGFGNSYYNISVGYTGSEANPEIDDAVRQLAEKHGGQPKRQDFEGKVRTIEVHFPTSWLGINRSKLDVILTGVGQNEKDVVQAIRDATDLVKIDDLVRSLPAVLQEGVSQDDADELRGNIESAGGSVTVTDVIEQNADRFFDELEAKHRQVTVSPPSLRTEEAIVIPLGIPMFLSVLGVWVIYRAMNYRRFADFLISVEAEIDKVSWSSKQELKRATVVVLITMVFLGFILFIYDMFWQWFFELIRFLQISS